MGNGQYRYRGISLEGLPVKGIIEAADEYEAVAKLRQTCRIVTKITPVRKNVKRAEKYQLSFVLAHTKDRIDDFLKIYYGTMDRRNAEKKYYFDKKFFQAIDLKMKDNNRVFFVSYEGKPVSTELVLISEENIYSYLGGTNPDYFEMRPNDFLKAKIIEWGHENGYKNYILGGGYGKEDGIYRYKKSFAPDGIKEFKIGSRVLNEEKYREICIQKGVEVKDDFIPAYRRN